MISYMNENVYSGKKIKSFLIDNQKIQELQAHIEQSIYFFFIFFYGTSEANISQLNLFCLRTTIPFSSLDFGFSF